MLRHLIVATAALLLVGPFTGKAAIAQEFNELTQEQLERQLNSILRTRLPEEKEYIAKVLKLVEEEKIPRRLINSTFRYVMKNRAESQYRFVYFVRVLQFQGRKARIAVPAFDFSIYSDTQSAARR